MVNICEGGGGACAPGRGGEATVFCLSSVHQESDEGGSVEVSSHTLVCNN